KAGREMEIARLLDMVGLEQRLLGRRPDEVSGGQQQRVALARALSRRPRLMLLDEPFSALDTGLRASTRRAVADLLRERAITTILVTHDQGEALSFADQVAVMHEGRLLQAGDPRDLYFRPATPFVAEFLGDSLILDAACEGGFAVCRFGRLPLDSVQVSGPAKILLRPEQIRVQQMQAGDDFPCKVEAVEFGGANSLITLRFVASEAADDATIVLRRNGMDDIRVGDLISISVIGTAHVFPSS
ncbi:MAG: amino acid transporter substrate-binding protein, partial [Hyphomicrobiales bacterium]|nr:amino acid transporter substrate-binding protein [Hyphomicrobiales bacterium]